MDRHSVPIGASLIPLGLLFVWWVCGCGDSHLVEGTAVVVDGSDGLHEGPKVVPEPEKPQKPEQPDLGSEDCPTQLSEQGVCQPQSPVPLQWACPEGWESVSIFSPEHLSDTLRQQSYCKPPVLPRECPPGWTPRLGETECVRLGMECPAGNALWHDAADIRRRVGGGYDGELLYVWAEAEQEGDGSLEHPFGTLGQALERAGDGDIVAVGVGAYEERVTLEGRVALVGSCVERTIVAPASADRAAVFFSSPRGAWLSDVTVSGSGRGVEMDEATRDVQVQSIHIDQATTVGLIVDGARSIVLNELFISETQPSPSTGFFGRGLSVEGGGHLEANNIILLDNHDSGWHISGRSLVNASDVAVLGTKPFPQPLAALFGRGVSVQNGARFEATRLLVSKNHELGLLVLGEGSSALLSDVVVSETQPQLSDQTQGLGLVAQDGSVLEVERVALVGNHQAGLAVLGGESRTRATLLDAVVISTEPQRSDMAEGLGLTVQHKASLEAERIALVGNHGAGLSIAGEGAGALIHDLVVVDTRPRADMMLGRAIQVQQKGQLNLFRAFLAHNHETGLSVVGEGTSASVVDVVVTDTQPQLAGQRFGRGVVVRDMATLELTRTRLTYNHDTGLFVNNGGAVVAEDLVIFETQPERFSKDFGTGVVVQNGAHLTANRVALVGNHESGLFITREGEAEVENLKISDTRSQQSDMRFGSGLVVQSGVLRACKIALERNNEVGLFVLDGAEVTISDLTVADTQPLPDFTLGRGITVQQRGLLTVSRALLVRNHQSSLTVLGMGSKVIASDLEVADTLSQQSDKLWGRGVDVGFGGELDIVRTLITNSREIGLNALGAETYVKAHDLVVSNTTTQEADMTMGGVGVGAVLEARIELSRFVLAGNALVGLQVAREGSVSATEGVISENFIGINVQGSGLEVDDLGRACVQFHSNCCGVSCDVEICNFKSLDLPIPKASSALDGLDVRIR